jgi:formate-dependent nitrite reductase membrane component NrfD
VTLPGTEEAPTGSDPPRAAVGYYGRAVVAPPVWTWEVPAYLFAGGLAGASAGLAFASEVAGRDALARRAWAIAGVAVSTCPPLLVSDLGRPERFLNMLRVFKVTSPMSVGSWLLAGAGAAIGVAAASRLLPLRGPLARAGDAAAPAAALLGLPLATYTGVLLADTAVPVWHEARRELPFLFAAGAAASAGAAAAAIAPAADAGPARRLAIGAAAVELAVDGAMRRRLGELAKAYSSGRAGRWHRAALALTAAGAAALAAGGRGAGARRPGRGRRRQHRRAHALAAGGGALTLAGSLATRVAVFRAGFASAEEPAHTIAPQRERLAAAPGGTPPAPLNK